MVYKESKTISFLWEVGSRNDIPIKLKQEHFKDEQGKAETSFYIPIWLSFKISNTGRMTFSVDSIFVFTTSIKGSAIRQFYILNYSLFQPYIKTDISPKERTSLPIVVESGHSKIMLSKVDLKIPETLYEKYMNEFRGKEFTLGDIFRLQNKNLRIGRNFRIFADVTLSGGEKKTAHIDIDGE
jgi:hypothetical protein